MDIDRYLDRIGVGARPAPSLAALKVLQRAHMMTTPFENLDVFMRIPLSLSIDDLFDKIVVRRRGGYCFELNTLFGALLRGLGFDATPVLGRVWLRDQPAPPPRCHLLHLVMTGGRRMIVDVGFGGARVADAPRH